MADESAFFADAQPFGFILFARNIDTPDQVHALCHQLRSSVGRNAPILIDQEGGRVQRLNEPEWPQYPDAQSFGEAFLRNFSDGKEKARATTAAIAKDLTELGINVNCSPVLDVVTPETHDVIGDRAFGHVGAGGSIGFADPECGLAFSYTMNQMGQSLLLNERCQSLIDATYKALGYKSDASGAWMK
mgnify:CR=1 FL=1